MKNLYALLIGSLVTLFPINIKAQVSSPPGPVQFISDAVKNAEGDTAINLAGNKFAAVYVPIRTIDLPVANAFDAGVGGVFGLGNPQGLASLRLNLPQIANGLFGTKWFTSHTHGMDLPTLFIGPAIKAEWPVSAWTWRKDAYLLIGIPFGSTFK